MIWAAVAACAAILATGFGVLWRRAERRQRRHERRANTTERCLAQAAEEAQRLRREVVQLRETLDALPMPVWRRRHNALVDCNRSYAAALGITREAALAGSRALVQAGRQASARLAAANSSFETHVVIDGQRRLLAVTENAGVNGETIGFAVDRSEAETAQAQLQHHIDAHADVLESIYAAVAIFGPDRRLIFFNSAFAALWELEEGWLAGEPLLDEILERLREARRLPEFVDFRAFKRERCAMFTSLIEPRHEVMHLPDGRTLQMRLSPHPFGGLTLVCEDVSDRLALERSYNTLIQVQRATLDHLFEGIAVYGSDGRLKLHNPAFRAMWGLSSEDVAGDPHIAEIVEKTRAFIDDGGDWSKVREEIVAKVTAQILSSGPLYRHDGSMLQVASVPLPDGEVLLTYLDISDTARVERALRQRNEALETADRLKSELIASVSHELRTPLNTVIGFAEILNNQYFGPLNSSQLEYCRGVLDSAHGLMTSINDILDLATIEAGYMALERGLVDIPGILGGVASLTREQARNRDLDLSLHCAAGIEPIEADERRLKQALFNLVANAIKFTPPGGAVAIEAARCGDTLLLSVEDTGPGYALSERERELERSLRAQRRAGSALGLSLVRNLIELHGGTIEICATAGSGTRVTCRLPATSERGFGGGPVPTGTTADLQSIGGSRDFSSAARAGALHCRRATGAETHFEAGPLPA